MATATTDPQLSDPLLSLRRALATSNPPTLTTSSELSTDNATEDLTKATHLYVTQPIPQIFPLSTLTRFVSAAANNQAIDLRSIYFAWLKKDVAIPEYIAEAQGVNEALEKLDGDGTGDAARKVVNLVFVERLDLITWLEGASEDSEYIKPLEGVAVGPAGPAGGAGGEAGGDASALAASSATGGAGSVGAADAFSTAAARAAEDSAKVASGAAGGVATVPSAGNSSGQVVSGAQAGGRPVRAVDPRLQVIYKGERKIGDRNSVLRGIRPTVRCPFIFLFIFHFSLYIYASFPAILFI